MIDDPDILRNFCAAIVRQALDDYKVLCEHLAIGLPAEKSSMDAIERFLKQDAKTLLEDYYDTEEILKVLVRMRREAEKQGENSNSPRSNVVHNLTKLRRQRGLTYKEVSRATGLSATLIRDIETDHRCPKDPALKALADLYEISLETLKFQRI